MRSDERAYLEDYARAAWATVEDLAAAPLDASALLLDWRESGFVLAEVRAIATALLGAAMLHDRPSLEAARRYFAASSPRSRRRAARASACPMRRTSSRASWQRCWSGSLPPSGGASRDRAGRMHPEDVERIARRVAEMLRENARQADERANGRALTQAAPSTGHPHAHGGAGRGPLRRLRRVGAP